MPDEIESLYPYNHPKSRLLRRMIELYGKTDANSILEALPDGSAGGGGFVPKGAVTTVSDLPSTGNEIGDIYIVTENGSEYVWITSETNPSGYWEELGQTIDLSAYELKPAVNAPTGDTPIITPAANTIYKCVELFPVWTSGIAYSEGNRVRYGEKLYRCNAPGHTSQDDWTPDVTPALWTEVAKPGVIPIWKQPLGDQDAYDKGDKVRYPDENGNVWVSVFDGKNVWQPGVYGWEKV